MSLHPTYRCDTSSYSYLKFQSESKLTPETGKDPYVVTHQMFVEFTIQKKYSTMIKDGVLTTFLTYYIVRISQILTWT